jgi:hypothetical protein
MDKTSKRNQAWAEAKVKALIARLVRGIAMGRLL